MHTNIPTLWEALCSQVRLSWILINEKTQQMVARSSSQQLEIGLRHHHGAWWWRSLPRRLHSSIPLHFHLLQHHHAMHNTDIIRNATWKFGQVTVLGMHLEDAHDVATTRPILPHFLASCTLATRPFMRRQSRRQLSVFHGHPDFESGPIDTVRITAKQPVLSFLSPFWWSRCTCMLI